MIYTDSFKAKMVQRLSAPNAISAISLSKEVGVSQSQLSRWLQRARTVVPMTKERPSDRAVQTAQQHAIGRGETAHRDGGGSARARRARRVPPPRGGTRRRARAVARDGGRRGEVGSRGRRGAVVVARRGYEADQGARTRPSAQGPRSRGDRGAAGAPKKVDEIWGDGDDGTGEGNAK